MQGRLSGVCISIRQDYLASFRHSIRRATFQFFQLMKPFLILQLRPEDQTADNEFEAFLKYGGIDALKVCRIRIEKNGIPQLNLNDYSAIIVGGSPFDVSTPENDKSLIQKKIEKDFEQLFDSVLEQDFPFLGACSGNGLLGNYCGASISEKYSEPVSGVDISVTRQGEIDPLLDRLPKTFRALVGHKEACDDTPPGAVLLATSDSCPVQMFRIKQNIYATQFHPEADADGFTVRINIYKHHGYFPSEQAESLIKAIKHESTPVPKKILKTFVDRYRI